MPAAKLAPQVCPRKQELVLAIQDVINHIIALNTEEHVTRGDAEKIEDLWEQLVNARIRRDSLLESYKRHVRVHGC